MLDESCARDLRQLGIARQLTRITHSPYFDEVVRIQKRARAERKSLLRKDRVNILYVSQPLLEFGSKRNGGYSQHALFEMLIEELSRWNSETSKHIIVWVHPKEAHDVWDKYAGDLSDLLSVEVTEKVKSSRDMFSQIVFLATSHSSVVYEALYFDSPCLSIQLNKESATDQLVTNKLGLSIPVYSRQELRSILRHTNFHVMRNTLKSKRRDMQKQGVFFSDGRATDRVSSLVWEMVCTPRTQ